MSKNYYRASEDICYRWSLCYYDNSIRFKYRISIITIPYSHKHGIFDVFVQMKSYKDIKHALQITACNKIKS